MCGPDGINVIKQDIEGEGVNTTVIAACSRRVLYDVFDFGPVIVNRVNLREGVVWSHKPEEDRMIGEEGGPQVDEVIQEMAEDYVRMGIAEAEKLLPVEPYQPEEAINKRILVMGGGISGLSAALEVAKTGYEAVVIEKEAAVGGFASKMRKQTPTAYPYENLEEPAIGQIVTDAEGHPKIEIRISTEVARIAGQPGLYDITLKPTGTKSVWDVMSKEQEDALLARLEEEGIAPGAREATPDEPSTILEKDPDAERFGAIILATGWKPWELKEEEPPAEEAAEGEGEGEKPAEAAAEA
ncbi:MAG: CoB--CoM heterodisulfide reductase iron-sulfur subunit A family protein, partial [Deltaproteobacteria bacterium]|nr:CoB--CoM heterodisulfide reductase iron-sulfur subunit A family protein [Deltaproteobacteria bacterium]